jgi:ferredoxin
MHCTAYGSNCFCTTVGTGPRAETGYDLALTEVEDGFLVETGTEEGRRIVEGLPVQPASPEEVALGEGAIGRVASEMPKRFDRETVARDLWADPDHPYWTEVAARCLGCTNCTMVCPTCFCYTTSDRTDLTDGAMTRERTWDSCFSLEFALVHGGNFRPGLRERYRHWVTHKLSTWVDQFGVLGCVGCGRCITWCPTKIDISETVQRISRIPSPRLRGEGQGEG